MTSSLSYRRRWMNVSKMDQRIFETSQGAYRTVASGAYVEGEQWESIVKNSPAFREVTSHLTQKEIYPLIQEEDDTALLQRFIAIENSQGPRTPVINMLEARINKIRDAGVRIPESVKA